MRLSKHGNLGVVLFVHMLHNIADVLQGCKLDEVNMAGVEFRNSHLRIGGAHGSRVQTRCDNLTRERLPERALT